VEYGAHGVRVVTTSGEMTADHVVMTVPLGVLKAGEASHPHLCATIHGAYETGIRAAWEIMGR